MLDTFIEILRNLLTATSEVQQNGWTFPAYLAVASVVVFGLVLVFFGGQARMLNNVQKQNERLLLNDPIGQKIANSIWLKVSVYIWLFGSVALGVYLQNQGWSYEKLFRYFIAVTVLLIAIGVLFVKTYLWVYEEDEDEGQHTERIVDQYGNPIRLDDDEKEET